MFMRLHIALPPDVSERVRTIADTEHRDVRRQIEKILIDSVRQYPEAAPLEPPPMFRITKRSNRL